MGCTANSPGSTLPPLVEEEIARRVAAERSRLAQAAGFLGTPIQHFRRPAERPFSAEERDRVTILFGGFTWKHERFIEAVFRGCGYRCQMLPNPNVTAFQTGKEFGNNGQCNPTYFTVGNLIQFLRALEAGGLSRQEILDNYVFFTAGSCGPCRFGMYESEYRMALENAGFGGFRVLLFKQDHGVKAGTGNPGLKFSVDLGVGAAINGMNLGDVINDMVYQIRPYEVVPGATDQAIKEVVDQLSDFLQNRKRYEILERTPRWISNRLAQHKKLKDVLNTLGKVLHHLYGEDFLAAMHLARERLNQVEVDRTRVKPVVKITGEFWAQTTEGDGNFNMFAFLEREGAQVYVDPIGCWITYLIYQARASAKERRGLDASYPHARWWEGRHLANEWEFHKKQLLLRLSEGFWNRQYARTARHMGGLAHLLAPQSELARLAHPFYHQLARGGEGHLEVGKNVYYTTNHLCHMVLALKPFGCMPSCQSDGVQSAVVNRFRDMIFLPIETSGEGEINAHSRVQMALGEGKSKAKAEFAQALASTGKRLDEIQAYVAEHRRLRSPFYPVPSRPGIVGVAANFVLHVSNLMDGKARLAILPGELRER
jgi:predicted nucleotide-binding protein (sugar kinase/HSP70/actin superfamily)